MNDLEQDWYDELQDWRDSARSAAGETCGDEVHCTCVGVLRKTNKDLKVEVVSLEESLGHACTLERELKKKIAKAIATLESGWMGSPINVMAIEILRGTDEQN